MPSTTTNLCQAKASYKKAPGLLELTPTHLQWTPTGKQAPSIRVPQSQAASLFCSKEGSAQVKLKLGLVGDDAGHTFMFTAPQASVEREVFKRELTNIIGSNRNGASAPVSAVSVPSGNPIIAAANSKTPASVLKASTPRPAAIPASRATSVSSNGRASSSTPARPIDDFRIRKKVLMKTPELAALHRELVISGQITEHEFWEGREHLLVAESAQEGQKRGRPGQLVDPRPQTVNGDVKIVITPQLVHDIFEEYPVVMKAYNETVPNQLSEADFWKRYFQSKLFNSHRASIRSSAAQHVVKADPIFDKYVEKDDNELEPRRQRDEGVELLIDLHATQEDHRDTGNQRDVTMQAGKQRGALPLIRRFNEHSERLLNSAMGAPPAKKRRIEEGDTEYYSQIDLDDLHDPESSAGIILEMQDRNRYFEGRAATTKLGVTEDKPDVKATFHDLKNQLTGWAVHLNTLGIDKKAGDAALTSMTQNVQARLEVKMRKNDIPEGLFQQMTTCQTAANEFLRQFWTSIYPAPSELQTLTVSTSAQKAAKAVKMVGYLSKTQEKVDALIHTAQAEGVDPKKIEVAMKPVIEAVEMALQFYRTRRPPR